MALLPSVAKKSTFAALAALIAGSGVAGAATVNQGDRIMSNRYMVSQLCTVGYVNPSTGLFYTAAHCVGKNGTTVFNPYGQAVGTVVNNSNLGDYNAQKDTATVRINRGHKLGKNGYSGDNIVRPSDVRIGDKICFYGKTSKATKCGSVISKRGNVIISDRQALARSGDSGGQSWIPGKGMTGTVAGTYRGGTFGTSFSTLANEIDLVDKIKPPKEVSPFVGSLESIVNGSSTGYFGSSTVGSIFRKDWKAKSAPQTTWGTFPKVKTTQVNHVVDRTAHHAHNATDGISHVAKSLSQPTQHNMIDAHTKAAHQTIDQAANGVKDAVGGWNSQSTPEVDPKPASAPVASTNPVADIQSTIDQAVSDGMAAANQAQQDFHALLTGSIR